MRIKSIEARWVQIPIEESHQHVSDFGRLRTFDAAIVRIETEDGTIGWGEGKNAAGSAGQYAALVHLINVEIAPFLIGWDASQITPIWEALYNGSRREGAAASGHVLPELARRGLTLAAISAIDIALWDIRGKSLGVPVWALLGGRSAERLPAYASGGWADAEGIGDQLRSYIESGGFGAVKMRVGAMDGAPHVSASRVRAARDAIGTDIELMVDAHGTYTVAEAKRFAAMVADCDLAWFEEPVTGDDLTGLAEFRRSTNIPVAAGESECTRFDFRDLMVSRAVDILQPDPAFCGGITEAMRIAAMASAFNMRLAPHLWAGAPAFFAGLHVVAAAPAGFIVEYSLGANPMIHELSKRQVCVADGTIAVPDAPGLGLDVNTDIVTRFSKN